MLRQVFQDHREIRPPPRVEGVDVQGEVVDGEGVVRDESGGESPDREGEQPDREGEQPFLESLDSHMENIMAILDSMRRQHMYDQDEVMRKLNDLEHNQMRMIDSLGSLRRIHKRTNDRLNEIEAHLGLHNFHANEVHGLPIAPDARNAQNLPQVP